MRPRRFHISYSVPCPDAPTDFRKPMKAMISARSQDEAERIADERYGEDAIVSCYSRMQSTRRSIRKMFAFDKRTWKITDRHDLRFRHKGKRKKGKPNYATPPVRRKTQVSTVTWGSK